MRNTITIASLLIYIAGLFAFFTYNKLYYYATPQKIVLRTDLTAYANPDTLKYTSTCDTVELYERNLPPYNISQNVLNSVLAKCSTDADSVKIITDFVYRILPFGGQGDVDYPGQELWEKYSFEQMYNFGMLCRSGINCGNRTIALEKILYQYGFKDVIRISYNNVHTFLLVRVNGDEVYIADAFSPYSYTVSGKEVGFITYLQTIKTHHDQVTYNAFERAFGTPYSILNDTSQIRFITALGYCDSLKRLLKPFAKKFQESNLTGSKWISDVFGIINVNNEHLIVTVREKPYWIDKAVAGYNHLNIWAVPDSVIDAAYIVPAYSDSSWALITITVIDSLRNKK